MLCLCGLPRSEAMNRSDLLRGSGCGSDRQRGWINIINDKEVSTNNCCKFMTIFIVFPGYCLKQLQQLFSDNS